MPEPGSMVATYQVVCHFLKSVGGVQTKGLVAPEAFDTDAGLPLIIRQVLIVPRKTECTADHKSKKGIQGEAMERKAVWCSLIA